MIDINKSGWVLPGPGFKTKTVPPLGQDRRICSDWQHETISTDETGNRLISAKWKGVVMQKPSDARVLYQTTI